MAYRKYKLSLVLRVLILFLSLLALAFAISWLDFQDNLSISLLVLVPLSGICFFSTKNFLRFTIRRFGEMDDFFESIKYRDFSRYFNEKSGAQDIRELRKGFNKVNDTFLQINAEKEAQHLYLQKILELIETGIIAYDTENGNVLWINEAFKKTLNVPSLKWIQFIAERKPELYQKIFKGNHSQGNIISIDNGESMIKIMISSSNFQVKEEAFKLIVIQNIDDPLNQNESEAWKKLLSVMTHEIMNSIAPISSLAGTLRQKIRLALEDSEEHPLEMEDLKLSIESIRSRSEGLMKFAKTYRGLNKIGEPNLKLVPIYPLLENICNLLQPSLDKKNVDLELEIDNPDLKVEIDAYLIEQVLINLLLNAIEACKDVEEPKVKILVEKNTHGKTIIKVADNGNGIPEEIVDKIFIPFFSTKKNGSGIGLSLCKQIMLMHKGRIQLNTREGKGTVISLLF
ncbi:MAG: HAMP domain-containing sensor histidine kinase [Bacteroidia bacterium]|nr:HAMP domain-containing sensor histidine kinase [Bacteroidia bacterium]